MTTTEIRLLGALSVTRAGENIPLTGRQMRTIFTLLAASPGTTLATDAIMTSLWPEDPPAQARKTVQVYVSNLRKALTEGDGSSTTPILTMPGGYSLALEAVSTDVARFDALVAEAETTEDDRGAISLLSDAIDLWQGPPFADLDIEELRGEAARLEEARIVAIEQRIERRMRLGLHAEVVGELEALALEHPYREGIRAKLMLALYRSGRQADALRVYTRTRDELARDLGLEPGAELQRLERDVLAQSVDLDFVPARGDEEGPVTFLVTELEDGAALWSAEAESMPVAIALHDEIVESAIVGEGGHVFKVTGEGLLAAMPTVAAAVAAATTSQTRLAEAEWPGSALRIRMAVDAGDVEYSSGDYFGPALNRACRVMASAHGGQVLVTEYAATSHLPGELIDLGRHDFRGLGQVGVLQLMTSVEAIDFPPLDTGRSVDAATHARFDHTIRGYEVRERLGEGVAGVVYRAYQSSVGREVAIKVIPPERANRTAFIRRFEVEAQVVAQLEHPHVVSLYDYWRDPDGAYLVMRLLKAGNLRSTLDRGALTPSAASGLLNQVGSALVSAHRLGVAHGNIKPTNVLFDEEGNGYLADFGVAARHIGTDSQTLSTPPVHLSPEEIEGDSASPLSDQYAFAMLAYEMLTATPPVRGQPLASVSALRPELSPEVDRVLQKATDLDRDARYHRVEDFLRAMREAIGVDVAASPGMLEPDRAVRNPYCGLRAFQESEAEDFFGRDALIDELVNKAESRPLVAVVGPSGSGKSSVVRAGLLPRLRSVAGDEPWFITEMFPGSYPFEELEGALARVAVDRLDGVSDELRRDELGLTRALKRVLPNDESRLLLVIDQFEELFSLTADQQTRELFLANLVAAASDARGRLTVVLTIRADFFHQPLSYGEFGELMRGGLVAVAMPTNEDLALAISCPARGVGLDLEPGLVNEIVNDVANEPGSLPLMQHALSELFHARRSRTLTVGDYRRSGGVLGALTRRANEIYGTLSQTEQTVAQQIFLRLVRADASADDTRRRSRLSDLHGLGFARSDVDSVLQQFGEFRLLSFDRDPLTRGPTVEVGHEALIGGWDVLRAWVDDRREDLLLERRLDQATGEWLANDRNDSFLLKEGRLTQFETFAAETDVNLTVEEVRFLERSTEEATRHAKRATTRRRVALAILAGLAVLASALALFALSQRDDARVAASAAETQALHATALRYAALADKSVGTDPELAIHLALEAAAAENLLQVELSEVSSALYNATFADRLVSVVTSDAATGFLYMTDGIHQINAAATQGMQPLVQSEPSGMFPTTVEIVRISDGQILGTIEDASGLSSYGWDPVTGEILTMSLRGEVSWRDPTSFELVRGLSVPGSTMALQRRGEVISYGRVTDDLNLELQTTIIDVETGAEVAAGPPDAFFGRLSASGVLVAVIDDLNFLRVIEIATGDEVTVIDGAGLDIRAWDWVGDQDQLALASFAGTLRVVDADTGNDLRERPIETVTLLRSSPDGRFLAAVPPIGPPKILDADTLTQLATLPTGTSQTTQVAWSADSTRIVTSLADGSSLLWDLGESTTSARAIPRIATTEVERFDFLIQNQLLVVGLSGDIEVRARDTDQVVASFPWTGGSAGDPMVVSADGGFLARTNAGSKVEVIDVSNQSRFEIPTSMGARPVAFSRSGAVLVTSVALPGLGEAPTGGYLVHDTATGSVLFGGADDGNAVEVASAADFAPDGTLFVAVVRDGLTTTGANTQVATRINDPQSILVVRARGDGDVVTELPQPANVADVLVSPTGMFVAVLDVDGVLRLYDTAALRAGHEAELARLDVGPAAIAISPDERLLLTRTGGTLTARRTDEFLREAWSIDLGAVSRGALRVEDGFVYTPIPERVPAGERSSGLVGFPLDRAALVGFAESKLSRELTNEECRQHLGLGSCSERLWGQ